MTDDDRTALLARIAALERQLADADLAFKAASEGIAKEQDAYFAAQARVQALEREGARLREWPRPDAIPVGELRVSIFYGPLRQHHLAGPMGTYPAGVAEIVRTVHAVLGHHVE